MKTLKVDGQQRIRLPGIKPGQVFAFEPSPDGSVKLIPVLKAKLEEEFPPGSLKKYVTKESNEEMLAILSGCVQGPIEDDDAV